MKCPTCLSVMRCISEIHDVPKQPGRKRMDLHCFNRENNDARKPNRCRVNCYMGVITEDPKPWQCHDYSFSFVHEGKHYTLYSHDYPVDTFHQGIRFPKTVLTNYMGEVLIKIPSFIPISTGDDMHEEAWELFHRIYKLKAFS